LIATLPETEAGFQDAIVEVAHLLGWRAAHFRPARTTHGWRTPGQYDAKGWPDLILTRSPRVVAIECKRQGGRLTDEQAAWLADLASCGIETHVAEPSDFDTIAIVLR
jgi:hypothetical protein